MTSLFKVKWPKDVAKEVAVNPATQQDVFILHHLHTRALITTQDMPVSKPISPSKLPIENEYDV